MNKLQRSLYFRDLWPAACAAQGWLPKDDARRRAVSLHATGTESTTAMEEWQVTALFTYLRHLGRPDDLTASAAWLNCQENPKAYNMVRQGKFWEKKTYGKLGTKAKGGNSQLHRRRFGNSIPATEFEKPADEQTAHEYLLTTRTRYQRHVEAGAIEPVKPSQIAPEPENATQTADEAVDCPF